MSNSKALATLPEAALPDLASLTTSNSMEIGSEDVSLPRLYMAQPNGQAVAEDLVPKHALWLGLSADDPEPNILWTLPRDGKSDDPNDGVLIHVLGVTKGYSVNIDGDLQSYAFGDPDAPETGDDGKKGQVTFNYLLCLPEVEQDVPVKLLLKSTSTKTAKNINFQLMKAASKMPGHALAFRLTTKANKRDTYNWTSMLASLVPATAENVKLADDMLRMIQANPNLAAKAAVVNDADEPVI